MSIDDAYVRAAKLAVSTDVSGIVGEVAVKEGQHVKAGDVLFRLDHRPFQIALAGAKANLAETALMHARDEARLSAHAARRGGQSGAGTGRSGEFDRYANLVKGGGVTRSEYDDARFKLASDQAAVEA